MFVRMRPLVPRPKHGVELPSKLRGILVFVQACQGADAALIFLGTSTVNPAAWPDWPNRGGRMRGLGGDGDDDDDAPIRPATEGEGLDKVSGCIRLLPDGWQQAIRLASHGRAWPTKWACLCAHALMPAALQQLAHHPAGLLPSPSHGMLHVACRWTCICLAARLTLWMHLRCVLQGC